ncbi:MAG: flagellar basal body L-ring protein FlgH [Candidatus Margulisbacteria bacterium]|nr:flagellar basal body L-ring protein FlgH [Candidatus Margulisiibacteriota bacterium]
MPKVRLLFVICCLLLTAGGGWADSIWNDNSASVYSTQSNYKVGDIINIIVLESSSAKNLATTKTNVGDDFSAKLSHTIQKLTPYIGANNSVTGSLANKYTGDGSTTRGSNVTARIAAWVTDVLPSGNLMIKGVHKVNVNNEKQEITITGMIRAKDISGGNTIYSYQVANADLSISGKGVVDEGSAPGFLSRIFNWIF